MTVNTSLQKLKQAIIDRVDKERPALQELAQEIHDNPEIGLNEYKASAWLTDYLIQNGFTVEKGICDMPTAFRAVYGKSGPSIGLLAEYDALPGVGHGCGHNLICTIAVGAAVASKQIVDKYGGRVVVIGTPAEEGLGGKIGMAEKGAFNELDAAMLVHPDAIDLATSNALACQNLTVEFFGKASHAAASPERGINALDAMILSFNALNALRQHIKSTSRIHGIITNGGQAPNVIPDYTSAVFIIRDSDDNYLDELEKRVVECFKGAATATGARLEYKWDEFRYGGMKMNQTLATLYAGNMELIGRHPLILKPGPGAGSTDMGNISQIVPAIHPMLAIAPRSVSLHSPDFAKAAVSEEGFKGMCDGAKAVAMTIMDLLSSPDTLAEVKQEFTNNTDR